MRYVLILLLLFGVASPSWAAIAEVGAGSQRATATACGGCDSLAKAYPANVTSGSLLIAGGVTWDSNTAPVVTDSLGTTYTVVNAGASNARSFVAYGFAPSTGANTVTVNPPGASDSIAFAIDEFSGVHATPLDVDGGSSTGTSTTPSDTILTVTANDLLVAVVGSASAANWAVGSGWTQVGENINESLRSFNTEFQVVTTVTTYTADWTTSDNVLWIAQTLAFKPSVVSTRRPVSPLVLP